MCAVGPTVLEVFNTLLRQLRQSVDYQLTGYYDNAGKHKTTSAEEKTLQDAVIKTIGQAQVLFSGRHWIVFRMVSSFDPVVSVQDPLPIRFQSTRGRRSCCSSWGRSLFRVSTPLWARPTPGTTHTSSIPPSHNRLNIMSVKETTNKHLNVLTSPRLSQVWRQQNDPGDVVEVPPPGEFRSVFQSAAESPSLSSYQPMFHPLYRYQSAMKAVICWRRCPRPSWSLCCPSLWWRIRRSVCWFSPSSPHSSTDATTPPDSPPPGHKDITQTQWSESAGSCG